MLSKAQYGLIADSERRLGNRFSALLGLCGHDFSCLSVSEPSVAGICLFRQCNRSVNMKHEMKVKKQGGFTITELMLVLGVGAVIMAGAFVGYKTVSSNNQDQQNQQAVVNLLSAVKNKWQGLGSYAAVTATAVNSAGLINKPLTWDAGNSDILNAYSKTVDFSGVASNFVAQITVPVEKCLETIGALDGVAYRIDVDAAGIAANAAEDAVKTVKAAGGAIDATKANTQCTGTDPVVTAFVK